MNIPDLPTDNLYKFAAVLGFILALLPLGYLAYRAESLAVNVATMKAREEIISEWLDDQLSVESPTATMEEVARIEDERRVLAVDVARVGADVDNVQAIIWSLASLSGLGALSCFWGFHRWYHRVQKFQDAKLAADARASSSPPPSVPRRAKTGGTAAKAKVE